MITAINAEIVKEYGLKAGASVVGTAGAEDFKLAPNGFKPSDTLESCLSVIVLSTPFPQESLSMNFHEYTEIRNGTLKKWTMSQKKWQNKLTA